MRIIRIAHLTASRFFGGPERQMLGLAQSLPGDIRTAFISFAETGLCDSFLEEVRRAGFEGMALRHDTPRLAAALRELIGVIRRLGSEVLCCHGYKANLLGLLAARWTGIGVIAVSRGWTGESFRIRLYEALDRRVVRWMDRVVCVSAAQAAKVRGTGVPPGRIAVIHNAIGAERFARPDPVFREILCRMFSEPPALIVGAAGRLSPEKGFEIFVEASRRVLASPTAECNAGRNGGKASVGFVLFGDGPLRSMLARRIADRGLQQRFVMAGFRRDFDRFLPHFDLFVQSSFTEGLPNVILEAQAAGVPVVATCVGGTPEVIDDGRTGWLVPPGDADVLAERIMSALSNRSDRLRSSETARSEVHRRFSFGSQMSAYCRLFEAHLQRDSKNCCPAAEPKLSHECSQPTSKQQ